MWQKTKNGLYRSFDFSSFEDAVSFINAVAAVASRLNHHPKIINNYTVVEIWLITHISNTVTKKDEQFAAEIDFMFKDKPTDEKNLLLEAQLFTDGGSRGNPGPSALGYAILDIDNNVVKKYGEYIGITTNNQAEYRALISGLDECTKLGVEHLSVYMDSELIVKQLTGKYRVKNVDLLPHYENVQNQAKKFKKISFNHVKREFNKLADSMVNEALDAEDSK